MVLAARPVAEIVAALLARPREVADLVLHAARAPRGARSPRGTARRRDRPRAASRVPARPAPAAASSPRDRACRARDAPRRGPIAVSSVSRNDSAVCCGSPRIRSRFVAHAAGDGGADRLERARRDRERGRSRAARRRGTTARRSRAGSRRARATPRRDAARHVLRIRLHRDLRIRRTSNRSRRRAKIRARFSSSVRDGVPPPR